MASLRNLFGNLTDVVGTKIGLPEWNLSEKIAGGATKNTKPSFIANAFHGLKPNVAQASEIINYPGLSSQNAPVGPKLPGGEFYGGGNPANLRPSGGGSTGVTGAPSGAFSAAGQVAGATTEANPYEDTQKRLTAEYEDRQRISQEQARGIFNPLIEGFSNQLSRLPGELESLRGGVEAGAEFSKGLVNKQLEGAMNMLGTQEGNVRGETQKSLRGLAEDQRNTTTSTARQLGARGAGDTSAGDYAAASIGRQGLKQRGSALESQATGLREIEGRRFEARNLAEQENNRIEQAKQQKLQELASDFQGLMRQLESAKNSASSDERRFAADQQNNLRAELSQRLSDLEGETRQRKAALQDWSQREEISLQNSLKLIAGRGAYDATDVLSNIGKAGNLVASLGGQATPQGLDYIGEQYIPGYQPGTFQPKPQKDPAEDPDAAINALIENALGGV